MKTSKLRFWALLCGLAGAITIFYGSLGMVAGEGQLLMPLDDAYIHFQYARQMATGHAYHYNPQDSPTSGATSFLYTPLLAIGYSLGLTDAALAYWAVGIGAVSLLLSAWVIHQILPEKSTYSYAAPFIFILTGAFSWAAFSGMETSLFVLATLFGLYAYQTQKYRVWAGVFAALVRPEGAVIAVTLAVLVFFQEGVSAPTKQGRWRKPLVLLPILAILVQPIVNLWMTGSASATGNQAKSHLYNVTQPMESRLLETGKTWLKLWREFLTGYSPVDGWYQFPLLGLGVVFIIFIAARQSWKNKTLNLPVIAGFWMLALSGTIATLDTAQWHFKRYQLSLYALVFPIVGWGISQLSPEDNFKNSLVQRAGDRWQKLAAIFLLAFALYTTFIFGNYYLNNGWVVKNQQMAMAAWVEENVPENATLAVHDVGIMRYFGERRTLDVVGLTSEGNAAAWRQGAGTLYERLAWLQPAYFAIYPDVLGLPFLVEAGVYGEELARFEIDLPPHTAASATGTQVVTHADWSGVEPAQQPNLIPEGRLVGRLNVADLTSEADFAYTWRNPQKVEGFATLVRKLPYFFCAADPCTMVDGGRVINGEEHFALPPIEAGEQYVIVARAEAASPAVLKIGCGETVDTAVVPALPGYWMDIPILLPAETEKFCLKTSDTYLSYHYWIYAVPTEALIPAGEVLAGVRDPFAPENTFQIVQMETERRENQLSLTVTWQTDGKLTHDGKFFVHVYGDVNQPPLAQTDVYLNGQPPANWFAGRFVETVILPLDGLATGTYTLAVGMYDPVSGVRYRVGEGDRLLVGNVVISD